KTLPITFPTDCTVFAFFFDGKFKWCHSILAFCFRLVAMKPAFVTCHNTRQKIITFISKSLKKVMGDGSSLKHLLLTMGCSRLSKSVHAIIIVEIRKLPDEMSDLEDFDLVF
ncbi:hypothetical protein L9F63_023288, partial [Diploptera punctata]